MTTGNTEDGLVIFVSYVQEDRAWAEWIAWQLKQDGWVPRLQAWHSVPGTNIVDWLNASLTEASYAVLVLSPEYLRSNRVSAEWEARFDPTSRRLVPVCVSPCDLPPLLRNIAQVDLADLTEEEARRILVQGMRATRVGATEPHVTPAYPPRRFNPADAPVFPGRDGHSRFMEQAKDACLARHPEARIEDAVPPSGRVPAHLIVVSDHNGYRERWPVGIHPTSLDRAAYEAFLEEVHAAYERDDPRVISELVHGGEPADEQLVRQARHRGIRIYSLLDYRNLWDARRYVARQTEKLERDAVYPPTLYVPQKYVRLDDAPETPPSEDLFSAIVDGLDAESARFVFVLGDFGHGKTFLLHELARRLPSILPNLVPVLVELRALEKTHDVDDILALHLHKAGEDGFSVGAVRHMLERGQIVLLFDGFDELVLRITYDQAAEHLRMLLSAVTGRAKVVLTCRAQHFTSYDQWRIEMAGEARRTGGGFVVRLTDFDEGQIQEFLVRLFEQQVDNRVTEPGVRRAEASRRAATRLAMIQDIEDLPGLSRNPRMLSFIAALDEGDLRAARSESGRITSSTLYEKLLGRWLDFEARRRRPIRGALQSLDTGQLWTAVTALALKLWESAENSVDLAGLHETVQRVLTDIGRSKLDSAQATYAVGSGSLLIHDEAGVGTFTFVHASVMEYLVARAAAADLARGVPPEWLARREMSPLTADFLRGAADETVLLGWVRATLVDRGSSAAARANAMMASGSPARLSGPALAHRDLRDRELSGLSLAFADLSDANLSGSRLRDVDLTAANLTGADLSNTVLERVTLRDATLVGTDFSGARLVHVDLQGIRAVGSRWHRAALLGVRLEETVAASPELASAAVVGRDPVHVSLTGAADRMSSVAYSPDGGTLLAAARGNSLVLAEARGTRVIRVLAGHTDRVWSVTFSPDGSLLASGAADGTVRLWEVASGRHTQVLAGHGGTVWSVAYSPDGSLVASGGADGTVRLWEVASGRQTQVLAGHGGTVWSVAYSPDGSLVASGGNDGTVRLWTPESGLQVGELAGHQGRVRSVTFSRYGALLASAGTDGSVRLWDTSSGRQIRVFSKGKESVRCLAFSPGGRLLASAGDNPDVQIWEVSTGTRRPSLKGHTDKVRAVDFSSDRQFLASASDDRRLAVWDGSGTEVGAISGGDVTVRQVSFSPDGNTVASAGDDKIVRLWDVDSGRMMLAARGHTESVATVAFARDGMLLISASSFGRILAWRVGSGRRAYERHAAHGGLRALWALSADGNLLASWLDNSTVEVLRPGSLLVRPRVLDVGDGLQVVVPSRSGDLLACGTKGGEVEVLSMSRGRRYRESFPHGSPVRSAAFSPDGKLLAASGDDGRICIWDVSSRRYRDPVAVFRYESPAQAVTFSPDGQLLCAAGLGGSINIWSTRTTPEPVAALHHGAAVRSVVFNPRRNLLASAGDDGAVKIWDTSSGALVCALVGLGPSDWAVLLPDGSYKIHGNADGLVSWAIKTCRFEIEELDAFDSRIRQLAEEEAISPPSRGAGATPAGAQKDPRR